MHYAFIIFNPLLSCPAFPSMLLPNSFPSKATSRVQVFSLFFFTYYLLHICKYMCVWIHLVLFIYIYFGLAIQHWIASWGSSSLEKTVSSSSQQSLIPVVLHLEVWPCEIPPTTLAGKLVWPLCRPCLGYHIVDIFCGYNVYVLFIRYSLSAVALLLWPLQSSHLLFKMLLEP